MELECFGEKHTHDGILLAHLQPIGQVLRIPLDVEAATVSEQIRNVMNLVFPLLNRDGVKGGILGCGEEALLGLHLSAPRKF